MFVSFSCQTKFLAIQITFMKTKFYSSVIATTFYCATLSAQTNTFPSTGAAGIGTVTPNASSLLEIKSTSKGILISRMTQAQRNAIVSPATGLMIYQTNNTPGFYYYTGTAWTPVSSGANTALSNLVSPTAINVNLLPGTDNLKSLGSASFRWKNLSIAGDASINGLTVGVGGGSVTSNTALGNKALLSNTTGYWNTAAGDSSLHKNTTGVDK